MNSYCSSQIFHPNLCWPEATDRNLITLFSLKWVMLEVQKKNTLPNLRYFRAGVGFQSFEICNMVFINCTVFTKNGCSVFCLKIAFLNIAERNWSTLIQYVMGLFYGCFMLINVLLKAFEIVANSIVWISLYCLSAY